MDIKPSRRSVMTGIGATIAASAIAPARTSAKEDPGGLAYRSAGELMKMLLDREVSSRELVDGAIARIEALDPKINAVVVRDFDRARKAADDADAALARGERRPLLGLPMTGQGAVQYRRPADHLGLSQVQGLEARFRCACRAAAQSSRRNHCRQDECAGEFDGLAEFQRGLRHHQ
jgi:hypothetical protein